MTRDYVLSTLREHAADFRAAGVTRLLLFGSVARDQAGAESDVDLLVDLDSSKTWSLLHYGGLQQDFSELLKTNVDLSQMDWLKPAVRERALKEAVVVF